MAERKFVSAAWMDRNILAVDRDGNLWIGTGAAIRWGRIPGPPADPVAKAEGELPKGITLEMEDDACNLCVQALQYTAVRRLSPSDLRAIASHLLAAADEAERGA